MLGAAALCRSSTMMRRASGPAFGGSLLKIRRESDQHLGHAQAAAAMMTAFETVLAKGPRTPDMGGRASTHNVCKATPSVIDAA